MLACKTAHGRSVRGCRLFGFPIGPSVVAFCGIYLESYKLVPKSDYLGPMVSGSTRASGHANRGFGLWKEVGCRVPSLQGLGSFS